MATFTYTNPTVGGSEDTWGDTLNANWDAISAFIGPLDSAELAVLDGITASTAELNLLDGVTATTAELNFVDGVTSSIQTQLDGKADDTDASIANSVSLTGAASDWLFTISGNNLVIKYGSTTLAQIDTSGNLTVNGDVTAFGGL